eukprot:scaffold87404_cov33-Phaeocystis_antarctica.AAC.1
MPDGPRAVKSATLEVAGWSTRGGGWAANGPASRPGSAEPPRAARRALRRDRSRPRALPRRLSVV